MTDYVTQFIEEKTAPHQTVSVFPEGYAFNFYTDRKPGGGIFYNLTAPYVETFGEAKIIDELKKYPPDFIVIYFNPWWPQYENPFFCKQYAFEVCSYIDSAYDTVYSDSYSALNATGQQMSSFYFNIKKRR